MAHHELFTPQPCHQSWEAPTDTLQGMSLNPICREHKSSHGPAQQDHHGYLIQEQQDSVADQASLTPANKEAITEVIMEAAREAAREVAREAVQAAASPATGRGFRAWLARDMVAEPEASMEVFPGVEPSQASMEAAPQATTQAKRLAVISVVNHQHTFRVWAASVEAAVQGVALGEGRRRRGRGGGGGGRG